MAVTGRVKAWKELLEKNIVLPVGYDRQRSQQEPSVPFNLTINSVEGLLPKNDKGNTDYQLRLSFFDSAFKLFFGRTWVGPKKPAKTVGQKSKLAYNQNVYFHTSLREQTIMLVLEIVAVTAENDVVSCGWGVCKLFRPDVKITDTTSSTTPPPLAVTVYNGSPRALLLLEEPFESNPNLTTISGCQAFITIRTHPPMERVQHLIQENTLLGKGDVIPGIAEGHPDPKNLAGGIDSLKKPRLLKTMPCYLERVAICLHPSIDKFEEELKRLLQEDWLNREHRVADGQASIEIKRRFLQVGVHNGWTYVADPQDVQLTPESSVAGHKRSGSLRKSHQRATSAGSQGSTGASFLVHKNRIELEGMVSDPMFTVVFTLLYELYKPHSSKEKTVSMTEPTVEVAVRFAAFSPVTNLSTPEQTLHLIGGPTHTPDLLFIFSGLTSEALGSSSSMGALGSGIISFNFLQDRTGKENIQMGQMATSFQLPPRTGSQLSLHTEGSSVLQPLQMNSSLPPVPPTSSRPGTSTQMRTADQSHLVPPLQGYGSSPPGTYGASPPGTQGVYGHPSYRGSSPQAYPTAHHGTAMLYQTPRGYVPLEVQHIYDGGITPQPSARLGVLSPELHELPYAPAHAPIMATAPGMHRQQPMLPRAAYAKLYTAGFPAIMDRKGEPPEVVDPADHTNFIAAKEETGRVRANEIVIQFLAFSRVLNAFETRANAPKQPSTVFFTFQFYRYPQVTTERLLLGNVEGELTVDPHSIPCLLQRLDKDGSILKGPPGYQIKYHVDPAYLKPGEGRLFVQHLAQQTLHIDVWDGDSLHLIGSSVVELRHICRQGREAVQVTYELDIISTEYLEHESAIAGDIARAGTVLPIDVKSLLKGKLHMRLANVGHLPDNKLSKTNSVPQPGKPQVVVQGGISGSTFLGGSLNALNTNTKSVGKRKLAKAQHLADTDYELAQLLMARQKIQQNGEHSREQQRDRKRKLARLQAVKQLGNSEEKPIYSSVRREKQERGRDLKTVEMYRSQGKHIGILSMLSQAITTEYIIHPSLGTTEFFEFVLKNPYNVEHTVSIECEDPEVAPILDTREWRHYKMLKEVYTEVEEGMFNTETKSGLPEIFLRPKESVNVPLKFLSFKADHHVHSQTPADPYKPQTKTELINRKFDDPLKSRIIKVFFKTQNNEPLAILALRVEPQPHIVDQTQRFYHPEQTFLKKSIRLPALHSIPGVPIGGPGMNQVFVRCSDPNVICESRKVPPGEPHDIFLKVAVGAFPQIKKFYLAVYADHYLTKPFQIWQFYIHAMLKVDVSCIEGQTSRFTLLLRGTQASRLVQCFPSHPSEMQIDPMEPFMLAANTLQELHVGVRPMQAGSKFMYINVVDIEHHQLIRSWLVGVSCREPLVTKAFELLLPVGGGKGCNKKISYTNSYPHPRSFCLRTNRADLLQFKSDRLELGGAETANMGLRFAPSMSPGSVEILVFINDEDDKNEETYCIKAIYQ